MEEEVHDWEYFTDGGSVDLANLPVGYLIHKEFIGLFFKRLTEMNQLIRSISFPDWSPTSLDVTLALPLEGIDYGAAHEIDILSKLLSFNNALIFMLDAATFYKATTWDGMGSVVGEKGLIYDFSTEPTFTTGNFFPLDEWDVDSIKTLLTEEGYDLLHNYEQDTWKKALYWSSVYQVMHTVMRYFSMGQSNEASVFAPSIDRGKAKTYMDSHPTVLGDASSEFNAALATANTNTTFTTEDSVGDWEPYDSIVGYTKNEAPIIPPATQGLPRSGYQVSRRNHNEVFVRTTYPLKIRLSSYLARGNTTFEATYTKADDWDEDEDVLVRDQEISINFANTSAAITKTKTYDSQNTGSGTITTYSGGTEDEFDYIMQGIYEISSVPDAEPPPNSDDWKSVFNMSSVHSDEHFPSGFTIPSGRVGSKNQDAGNSTVKLIVVEMPNDSFETPMPYE